MKHIKVFEAFQGKNPRKEVQEIIDILEEAQDQLNEGVDTLKEAMSLMKKHGFTQIAERMRYYMLGHIEPLVSSDHEWATKDESIDDIIEELQQEDEEELEESAVQESKVEANWNGMETVLSYKDLKGHNIEVKQTEGEGMAGEPMTYAYIYRDGKIAKLKEIKKLMRPKDFKELSDYLNDISDSNYNSAVSFVI